MTVGRLSPAGPEVGLVVGGEVAAAAMQAFLFVVAVAEVGTTIVAELGTVDNVGSVAAVVTLQAIGRTVPHLAT